MIKLTKRYRFFGRRGLVLIDDCPPDTYCELPETPQPDPIPETPIPETPMPETTQPDPIHESPQPETPPVIIDTDIETIFNDMKNVFNLDIVDLFFTPLDKMFIDFADIMKNNLNIDTFIVNFLLYDETLKMSANDYPIEQRSYSLGFYKSIGFILFYAFIMLSRKLYTTSAKLMQ